MTDKCPNCGAEKDRLGTHWRMAKNCDYPEYPENLQEVVEGLLLSDGSIHTKTGQNGVLEAEMTNQEFIDHLDGVFGPFSRGSELKHTAEEVARKHVESGFNPSANASRYRDKYSWSSRAHPCLTEMGERWYSEGKNYPEDLTITPRSAKYWYAGDGGLSWRDTGTPLVQFTCESQIHRGGYLRDLFGAVGFEVSIGGGKVRLRAESSREFLSWVGDPLPGFEYKWENESREEYKSLMQQAYDTEDRLREVEA